MYMHNKHNNILLLYIFYHNNILYISYIYIYAYMIHICHGAIQSDTVPQDKTRPDAMRCRETIYVCIYIYIYIYTYISLRLSLSLSLYIYIYIYPYDYVSLRLSLYIYIYICIPRDYISLCRETRQTTA